MIGDILEKNYPILGIIWKECTKQKQGGNKENLIETHQLLMYSGGAFNGSKGIAGIACKFSFTRNDQ
jgi:hypothetical protein